MKRALLLSALFGFAVFASESRYIKEEPKKEEVQPPQEKRKTVEDLLSQPVSVNVRDVDLVYLFAVLSNETGVPITLREVPDKVKVSYFSTGKSLRVVLEEIASANDLWWERTQEGVNVYKYKSAVYKITLPLARKEISEQNDSAKLTLTVNRSYWNKIEESLKGLLFDKNSRVVINDMGYAFVYARPSELKAVESAIKRIEQDASKEVPLEISVMLMDEDTFREVGFAFDFKAGPVEGRTTPPAGIPFLTLSVLTSSVEARLRALAESGKINVVEKNRIVALNGQPIIYAPQRINRIVSRFRVAFMSGVVAGQQPGPPGGGTGQTIPTLDVVTEDVPEGSYLLIVPQYLEEHKILFDLYYRLTRIERINQVNLSVIPNAPPNTVNLPVVSSYTNLAQTTLQKGSSAVLFSGALTREEITSRGIPFLKDIPVLGQLFSTKGKEERKFRLVIQISFKDLEG